MDFCWTLLHWTVYQNHDALNRPHDITAADGGSVHYDYTRESGLQKTVETVTVLTPDGSRIQTKTRTTNALGQVQQVIDAHNTPVDYTYDSQGNLKTTTVANNPATTITVEHDVAGNKSFIDDPDAGTIEFAYNGFNELRRQTWQPGTADEKTMEFTYDALGRKTARIDTPAGGSPVSYSWTWDTVRTGLLSEKAGNGFSESYQYDSLSRPTVQTTTIAGLGSRSFGYTYDDFSRPETVTYPDGLTVEHRYHGTGLRVQTLDISDAGNPTRLWTRGEDSDPRGNLIQQRFGNGAITLKEHDPASGRLSRIRTGWPTAGGLAGLTGNLQDLAYEFDTLGNLYERNTGRTDVHGNPEEYTAEFFSYDALNRLKTSDTTWDDLGTRQRSYNYDALGNLTDRSDVGTLTYDQSNGAGVHAVTSANGQSYQYDAYGNLKQRGAETLDYDVFNKPTRIGTTEFSYGPDHQRFKQTDGSRITYYINGGRYKEIVDGTETTTRSTVGGYYVQSTTDDETDITYLHKDHLGSVEAMTDRWGNRIDRMSFDPWGQRQSTDWSEGDPTGGQPGHYPTDRGFTGHEMLDSTGLVHMNGRVYDPTLGRFLSPDLLIQAPYNSQSYNRYSYVLNNPLGLIDPSGYHGTSPQCQGCIDFGMGLGSVGFFSSLSSGNFAAHYRAVTFSPNVSITIDEQKLSELSDAELSQLAQGLKAIQDANGGHIEINGEKYVIGYKPSMDPNNFFYSGGLDGVQVASNQRQNYQGTQSDRIRKLENQARQVGPLGQIARAELAKIGNGGSLPSLQTQVLFEETAKGYVMVVSTLAIGPSGRVAASAGEQAIVRSSVFMMDPKGGFFKGLGVGFLKGYYAGDAPVTLETPNRAFQYGYTVGESVGSLSVPLARTLFGLP